MISFMRNYLKKHKWKKYRRHTNTKGLRQTQSGHTAPQVRDMIKRLLQEGLINPLRTNQREKDCEM